MKLQRIVPREIWLCENSTPCELRQKTSIWRIFSVGIAFILTLFLWAYPFMSSEAALTTAGKGFQTQSLDMLIVANVDNTYNVTEKWIINYYKPMHGIFRTIAQKGAFKFIKDDKPYNMEVGLVIQDIKVDGAPSEVSKKGDTTVIRIGDPNSTVTGLKEYTISYKLLLPPDRTKDFDLLYLELKPKNWETNIDHFHIKLILPKEVEPGQISTYSGVNAKQGNTLLRTNLDEGPNGTMIYEATGNNLPVGSVATVFMFLPEGYFTLPEAYKHNEIIIYGLAFVLLLLPGLFWYLVGRDGKVVSPIEFYPPNDMTPLEIQKELPGHLETKHIMAEVMYLAGRGYLKLEPIWNNGEPHKDRSPDDFIITKVKSMPSSASPTDKSLVDVFVNRDRRPLSEMVSEVDTVVYNINFDNIGHDRNQLNKTSIMWQVIISILVIFCFSVAVYLTESVSTMTNYGFISVALAAIALIKGIAKARFVDELTGKGRGIFSNIISVVFLLAASYSLYSDWMEVYGNLFMCLCFIGALIIAIFFVSVMHRPNERRLALKGRIWGFRDFLEKTEINRIKVLFNEDPKYFFKILPYAFLFGLADKWIPLMAEFVTEKPDWIVGEHIPSQFFFTPAIMSGLENSFAQGLPAIKPESIGSGISDDTFGGSDGGFGGSGGFGGGGAGGGGGGGW